MSEAAELSVVIKGKEVGIKSLLAALERDLGRTDAAAARAAQRLEADLARAQQQAAIAGERLAQQQARTAGELLKNEAAMSRAAAAALRLEQAQERAARPPSKGLSGFFADIKEEAAGAAAGMLGFGAAVTAASAAAQSFADAFTFKAELDATTASINIQLQGVRDSGQVWQEAATYAERYKLTQQETASTIQASVGILRESNASVEDTFGVLQRLTVLAPGKTIEDAAFSVRELASGDITSIAEQFNISRTKAYEMRDAVNAGADVVTVLSGFLDEAGVSMDALKVRTEGAMGAMKDLAIAQEDLKLAQAEFAQGPGLAFLNAQIEATRGGTRLLSGEFGAMGDSLVQAFANGEPAALALAESLGITGAAAQEAAQRYLEGKASQDAAAASSQFAATAYESAAQAAITSAESARLAGEANALFANGLNGAAQAAIAQANGTDQAARANQASAESATAAATAIGAMLTKTLEDKAAKEAAEAQARMFAEAQERIAALGASVAAGLSTSAAAAATLAAQYGITTAQALALVDAQARIAGGEARLAREKRNTRDLVPGGPGVSAPGRRGQSDDDILSTVKRTTDEITAVGVRAQAVRTATVKTGGAARVKAEQDSNAQLLDAARDYQDAIADIEADGRKQRQQAEDSLRQSVLSGRAGFYAGLANIDDNALRQDLSARYEAAATEAARIAQTQGADAAQKYLEASRQQIEGEAQIQQQIQEARDAGDAGQAEYLEGVLKLQQAANAEELRQIQAQGSAIAAAEAARYADAEARYAEHLAKMSGIAAANGTTLSATLPAAPGPSGRAAATTPAPAAPTTSAAAGAQPVQDIATPPAIDAQTARLSAQLETIAGKLDVVAERVSATERAITRLPRSGATAGG